MSNANLKPVPCIMSLAALLVFGCGSGSAAPDTMSDGDETGDPSHGEPLDDHPGEDGGRDDYDAAPPEEDAGVVSVSLPETLTCETSFNASITFRNTGSVPWTYDAYKMGMVGDSDPFLPGGNPPRVDIPAGTTVPANGTVTFNFVMTAPSDAGTYTSDYQMVREDTHWFGEIVTRQVEVTGSCTAPAEEDDAEIVDLNFPATLHCWDAVHASLTVRNIGTATWTYATEYKLGVSNGESPPGAGENPLSPNGTDRYLIGEMASIATGDTTTFWFTLFQENPGDYTVHYQMVHEGVTWFPATPLASVTVSVVTPCEPSSWESSTPPSQYLDTAGGVNWAIDGMIADYPPDADILFATGTGPSGNGCTGTYYIYDTMMYSYGVAEKINHGPAGLIATVDPYAGDEMTVKQTEAFSEAFDIIANPAVGGNCIRRAYLGTSTPAWP